MKDLFTVCLIALILSGCGLLPDRPAKWIHPTNPQAQIKSDHRECAIEAWKRYPKVIGLIKEDDGYWQQGRYATTNCQYNQNTKSTYCMHTPGIESKWINGRLVPGDENAEARNNWYGKCMTTKDPQYKCVKGFSTLDGSMCGHYTE